MILDRDKAKVAIEKYLDKAFNEEPILWDGRHGYVSDNTVDLMAESALNVLMAVDDVQVFIDKEIKDD